ncbi:hypothetical protein X766_06550 [Mesorhizobium sp. LSJC255A00]|nr:hypothetical protein X766_06550 [Mesorhizobium sp. LSJC255A00]
MRCPFLLPVVMEQKRVHQRLCDWQWVEAVPDSNAHVAIKWEDWPRHILIGQFFPIRCGESATIANNDFAGNWLEGSTEMLH